MKHRLLFAALHTTDVVARARGEYDALVHEGAAVDAYATQVGEHVPYRRGT